MTVDRMVMSFAGSFILLSLALATPQKSAMRFSETWEQWLFLEWEPKMLNFWKGSLRPSLPPRIWLTCQNIMFI